MDTLPDGAMSCQAQTLSVPGDRLRCCRSSPGLSPSSQHSLTPYPSPVCACIPASRYTLFSNLAIRQGGNLVWELMHGPVNIVVGVVAGLLTASFCSATRLWDSKMKRVAVVFFAGAGGSCVMCSCGWQLRSWQVQ